MKHPELLKVLELNKTVLRQLISVMTEAEIQRRIKDYWTVYEHLAHLVEAQEVAVRRIGRFLHEEAPAIVPFSPDKAPETASKPASAESLLEVFCQHRDTQLTLLRKAKTADWKKTGSHPEYTRYTLEILVRHTMLHDHFHMFRMEQLWIMKEEFLLPLESN